MRSPVTSPVTLPIKLPVIFVEFKVVIVPIPDTFKLLSFKITPSIVTPLLPVFSLILSTDRVPSNDIWPPSPVNKIVSLLLVFFTSTSLKLPCREPEIKFVPPTA